MWTLKKVSAFYGRLHCPKYFGSTQDGSKARKWSQQPDPDAEDKLKRIQADLDRNNFKRKYILSSSYNNIQTKK
jgi:hypothetical protein